MDIKTMELLLNQGWYISNDGFNVISNNGAINDVGKLIQIALDTDLKDIGKPSLPSDLSKSKLSNVVLQIQKVRNVSAPKSNQDSQAAPRMLKLVLTDGQNYCQAIEINNIPFLSHTKTAPGSKLLIKNSTLNSGYILLDQSNCQLLGGNVPAMVEKWEVGKSVSKVSRVRYDGEGPPPWVNFGQKILTPDDIKFKALEEKNKVKESSEFDLQRKDAIAEVASGAIKKVFGGGLKQNLTIQAKSNEQREIRKPREKKVSKKEAIAEEKLLTKPSDKISLFDFLETKLPTQEETEIKNFDSIANNKSYDYDNKSNNKPYNRNNYGGFNKGDQDFKFNNQSARFNNHNNMKFNNYNNAKFNNDDERKYDAGNKQNTPRFGRNQYQQQRKPQGYQSENTYQMSNNESAQPAADKNVNSLSNNFTKLSVNSEFASRSLKQHLNIKSESKEQKKEERANAAGGGDFNWKNGDRCMAKYWEDNKYYNATITAVAERTCVVRFNDYGNFEEVLITDCLPIKGREGYAGGMEFRRGGNRPYKSNKNYVKQNF